MLSHTIPWKAKPQANRNNCWNIHLRHQFSSKRLQHFHLSGVLHFQEGHSPPWVRSQVKPHVGLHLPVSQWENWQLGNWGLERIKEIEFRRANGNCCTPSVFSQCSLKSSNTKHDRFQEDKQWLQILMWQVYGTQYLCLTKAIFFRLR